MTQQATELIAKQMAAGSANARVWADILYNVKLYGAKGDGVADDTAAIQATINAANTAGGGVVYLPKGAYKITSGLKLSPNIVIRGGGRNLSIIRPQVVMNVFSLINTVLSRDNIELCDFGIIADIAGCTGIATKLSAAHSYHDLYFGGLDTFNLDRGSNFQIHRILVEGTPILRAGKCSFSSQDTANYIFDVNVVDYEIRNIGNGVNTPAITFYRAVTSYINNFHVNDLFTGGTPADGILISDDCQGLKILNSVIAKPGTYGIKFIQPAGTPAPSFTSVISVDIDQAQVNNIQIDAGNNIEIIGGNFTNYLSHGVVLGALSKAVLIEGNIFNNGTNQGVQVNAGATDFQIIGNYMEKLGAGVLIGAGASNRYTIIGNNMANLITTKISDSGTGTNKSISNNIGYNPQGLIPTPAIPATGVAYSNTNGGCTMRVAISGGTVTQIAINGTNTGLTSGMVILQPGDTITITYSVSPAWFWFGM